MSWDDGGDLHGHQPGESVSNVLSNFGQLSNGDKTEFIEMLLERNLLGPDQKWHLQQKLPEFLFRDFFTLLPDEVLEMVLSYLDCQTLLRARQVSRLWRSRLAQFQLVWQRLAIQLGGSATPFRDQAFSDASSVSSTTSIGGALGPSTSRLLTASSSSANLPSFDDQAWMRRCAYALKMRSRIKNGSCFTSQILNEIIRVEAQVTSIDIVGTGDTFILALANQNSDTVTDEADCILLWSHSRRRILKRLQVLAKVCVVKSNSDGSMIVSGHNNGTITVWNFDKNGDLGRNFQAHSASIFTLEINKNLQMIASGSADKSVKFWSMTGETFIKSLSNFSHWVVKILMFARGCHEVSQHLDKNLLFSMTKDYITLHVWDDDGCVNSSSGHIHLVNLSEPVYSIPLCTGKSFGFRDIFFTPGLHLYGDNLGFIKQMPMFETHTIGDADIVIASASDGKTRRTIHVNKKVRKLLGIGRRFALLLLPYVDNRYKNVVVVDLREKKILGGFTVPHSRPYTPDFSQIAISDASWLDGISENNTEAGNILVTLATNYEHLHIVQWNLDRK